MKQSRPADLLEAQANAKTSQSGRKLNGSESAMLRRDNSWLCFIPLDVLLLIVDAVDTPSAVALARTCQELKYLLTLRVNVQRAVPFDVVFRTYLPSAIAYTRKAHVIGNFQHVTLDVDARHQLTYLPQHTRCITFDFAFNDRVDDLVFPSGLEQLTFGTLFNQPLDRLALPPRLQQLTFGYYFYQPVDRLVLPAGLQQLTFGD